MIRQTKKKINPASHTNLPGKIIKKEQKHYMQREIVKFSVSGSAKQAAYFFLSDGMENLS
jgi:hypothetical protein